jgi:hypothetical protein
MSKSGKSRGQIVVRDLPRQGAAASVEQRPSIDGEIDRTAEEDVVSKLGA